MAVCFWSLGRFLQSTRKTRPFTYVRAVVYLAFLAVSTSGCFGIVCECLAGCVGAETEPAVQHLLHPRQPRVDRHYRAQHLRRRRPAHRSVVAQQPPQSRRVEDGGRTLGVPAAGGKGGVFKEVEHSGGGADAADIYRGRVGGVGTPAAPLLHGTVKAHGVSHGLVE